MALILFVEYHSAFRQAASHVMDQEPNLEVVAQAGSVAEGREKMAEGGIDAALVDIPSPTRALLRWSGIYTRQPAPGGTTGVHRRTRSACSQWARFERLQACNGCGPYSLQHQLVPICSAASLLGAISPALSAITRLLLFTTCSGPTHSR